MLTGQKRSPVSPPGAARRSTLAIETPENRHHLVEMAKVSLEHVKAGNVPSQTAEIMRVPASRYLDRDRWSRRWPSSAARRSCWHSAGSCAARAPTRR